MHQGLFYKEILMSAEPKKKYSVGVTSMHTHYYEVTAQSEEEAKQMASDQFSNGDLGHDVDHDYFIEDEDVLLLEDETATQVINA